MSKPISGKSHLEIIAELREQLAAEERRANDSIDENVRLMNKLAAEREKSHWLGELLAVIHGDGGHYRSEHGTEKAVKDAIQKRTKMIIRIDELEKQLADNDEKWKEKVELLQSQLNDNDEQWNNKLAAEREKVKDAQEEALGAYAQVDAIREQLAAEQEKVKPLVDALEEARPVVANAAADATDWRKEVRQRILERIDDALSEVKK